MKLGMLMLQDTNKNDSNKRKINEYRERKTEFFFNFYIVNFGEENAWLGREFFDTVFNQSRHVIISVWCKYC